MNYRHAFHAGNFADVLKHAVLALVIEHLKLKPTPFRVVDTHAGAGTYRLDSGEAERTGEWRRGIGRLLGPEAAPLPADVEPLLAPYLGAVRAHNGPGALVAYPGSPGLALALMRDGDRLVANELHPEDAAGLRRAIGRDRRARVLAIDGWQALRASLPPRERRGVVLVDPPFEVAGELARLADALPEALRRFATGTYLMWFPVKDQRGVTALEATVAGLGLDKVLWLTLDVGATADDGRLARCGLLVVNPPYRLPDQLRILLPFLAGRLAVADAAGTWELRAPGLASAPLP